LQQNGCLKIKEENLQIKYFVKKSGSRYIYLRFKPNLQLEVVLPFYSSKNVEEILKEKSSWILRKYKELLQRKKIFDGKKLLIDGEYYQIISFLSDNEQIEIIDGHLTIRTNKQNIMPMIKSWMKNRTDSYLRTNLPIHAKKLGVNFTCFTVKDICRWGYCNKRNELFFNLQLSALSKELKDYILIHELLHIVEFNHSKKFHKLLDIYCPNHRKLEKDLNQIVVLKRGKNIFN
jgi:predicted metal-dependent hydrolase